MRKKVDERIRRLLESGAKQRHRSMFVIIGDKSYDQIVNLHYMLSKCMMKAKPTVLWCMKSKLDLSSNKEKRAKQIKKLTLRGLLDKDKADSFSLFIDTTEIKKCKYRDCETVLGNTYGMCILQDFEALTPNILARTIETVEGGGLVVLLLRSLSSVTSLYNMVMDVHRRFRTESHSEIISRFNERFLLSLASSKACLVLDDELNILPISSHVKSPIIPSEVPESMLEAQEELKDLKVKLHDVFPVGPLVNQCTTLDQGKSVSILLDTVLDKDSDAIIALIASRGRGKSAALGLTIAGAIAAGYSNIYVTAPSPENLISLFKFVIKGLRALKFEEERHFKEFRSNDTKAVTQIKIFKEHRQIIQYIQPQDHKKISLADLLVVDEAAAIPLPIVESLLGMGPRLVFLSSTVNGYEGTGRALSLKLLEQLEKSSSSGSGSSNSGRLFRKLELKESIRYSPGDPIESWLSGLLCLDSTDRIPPINSFAHPSECNLYYVNRDTLFSFHKESERFLQHLVALYASSHYRNSPNDLQLMADAPSHHLFVLLGPVDETRNTFPDIYCFIQVCLEGQIAEKSAYQSLERGKYPSGDQIPWKFCEEFRNTDFPHFSGVRVVRIAVHPGYQRAKYGSTALDLLTRYYEGKLTDFDEISAEEKLPETQESVIDAAKQASLLEDNIYPRQNLPPLLVHVRERLPERVDYIGASFGLNHHLFSFWKQHKFAPFYICENPNDSTGEHSCMVLKPLESLAVEENSLGSIGFLSPFYQSFRRKFIKRLPLCFKGLDCKLVLSILDSIEDFSKNDASASSQKKLSILINFIVSHDELKLLGSYPRQDCWKVKHLLPLLAHCYFLERLPVVLSPVETLILLCMGLQHHDISYVEGLCGLEREQVLYYIWKVTKAFHKYFCDVLTADIEPRVSHDRKLELRPHPVSLEEDLNDGARQAIEKMKVEATAPAQPGNLEQHQSLVDIESASGHHPFVPKELQKYCVEGNNELEQALQNCSTKPPSLLSVKSVRSVSEKRKKSAAAVSTKRKKNKIF